MTTMLPDAEAAQLRAVPLEWTCSSGIYTLRPPIEGWPEPLRGWRLLRPTIRLLVYRVLVDGAVRVSCRSPLLGGGSPAYMVRRWSLRQGASQHLFASAFDALRFAIVEYDFSPERAAPPPRPSR